MGYRFRSDAIALHRSRGMSKRARKAAEHLIWRQLFGDLSDFVPCPKIHTVEDEITGLLRRAQTLRDLASRGMCVRKYPKEATRLEAQAKSLASD